MHCKEDKEKENMDNDKTTIRLKKSRKLRHNNLNTTELLSKLLLKIERLEERIKYLELDSVHLYEMIEK